MGRVFVAGSINMDVVATADRHPQVAWHHRWRRVPEQVVRIAAVTATYLEHVAEPLAAE